MPPSKGNSMNSSRWLSLFAFLLFASLAGAADFPTKPLRLVVPYPPGGLLDNLGRAIWAADSQPDAAGLLQGVKLVSKQLQTVLERHHCVEIDALHEPFDPHRHQAVMQQPSAEHPEHTIVQVLQPGYQLHDRVIRPAQVIVSTAPHSPDPKS